MPNEHPPFIGQGAPAEADPHDVPFVPQPNNIAETGIDLSLLTDLALKTIYLAGRPTGRQVAEQLALPFSVADELIAFLRQEQAIEIVGSAGIGDMAYQYVLSGRGREKAEEALDRNQYVGPVPVPFQLYVDVLKQQAVSNIHVDRDTFLNGLSHLVLNRRVLAALGPAVNSGQSVLLYGASGNGKTAMSLAMGAMLSDNVVIPYAVEVYGQIIKVFDPQLHRKVEQNGAPERREALAVPQDGRERRRDRRWAIAKRPVVSVGGELTLQDLELRYSASSKFYIAPLQWKANSGLFIIDDFGRQMIKPQELLNRWIVPMEQGVDHLSLHTGDTIELPFEILLIFSTNIPPGRLGDEAFFRRIRHKVEVPSPTQEEFLEILRKVCAEKGVEYTDEGARYLLTTYYEQDGRELKACHPRDLMDLLLDMTRFFEEEPSLTPQWIDLASASYFVDAEAA